MDAVDCTWTGLSLNTLDGSGSGRTRWVAGGDRVRQIPPTLGGPAQ